MSFTDPLALEAKESDGSAFGTTEARPFIRLSTTPDGSIWLDTSSTISEPVNLVLQNTKIGKLPNVRIKRRVAITRLENGVDNVVRNSTVALTFELPTHGDFTMEKFSKDFTTLLSFLGISVEDMPITLVHSRFLQILRGES
jgi:hypothetical protein